MAATKQAKTAKVPKPRAKRWDTDEKCYPVYPRISKAAGKYLERAMRETGLSIVDIARRMIEDCCAAGWTPAASLSRRTQAAATGAAANGGKP